MSDAQPLDPTDPLRLGAYRVTGRLGSGGQGWELLWALSMFIGFYQVSSAW